MTIFLLTSKATILLALLCAAFCFIYRFLTRKKRYDEVQEEGRRDEKS
ncbi:hypothetical protein IGI67_002615 [Enterococcus sp. AZ196]